MPSINRIITARTAPLSMAADAPIMLPASAPTVTEHTPTSRAQRDASMIRLRTSRPNWSVPKRCAALGSANRFSVSIFSGSAGIQKNEMIHIAAMLAAMIAPAQKDTLCFSSSLYGLLSGTDSGVGGHNRQIRDQRYQNHHGGNKEHDSLQKNDVPLLHGSQHQTANARQSKNCLYNDRPPNSFANCIPEMVMGAIIAERRA